ncbi:Anti-Sigma-factor antagonist (STAS) domain protein [Trichormus variabilis ATCC 29413]|uniref:Anti-sigma factor antagonist n=2 Tax=Anabaena variabilis TaxID=264691 RepID=Q3MDN3_TRIV2|nr:MULTISPECIES: STAS domain-containing protein [Nostocaceae]ABA20903.1 Anti-Sigma-factor antagonist (STAS) domain protein [Trichormus variabilis ATCC 29413]MBC1213725.1 anti-sigma factor antagonist [Trichormus variabilis ARAD]MBC1254293.1 anti-sigma factor antagonist [Trichormus variabilis V5]MBC1267701.1 anti-sigma factor antagonist [Trichormus variabilis FSR]MBC1302146.1 anti-sigma factor antagonist [Trichormus variabilis N2B]
MQAVLKCPKIQVIRPYGCLNATNALEFEQDLTKTLAKEDISSLWVDLADVESLDSSGLMALVSALKIAQNLGKGFQLYSVSPATRIIFELTQLNEIFEIFEHEAELVVGQLY